MDDATAETGTLWAPDAPDWSRRLLRTALWLLAWVLLGLVLAGLLLVVAATLEPRVPAEDPGTIDVDAVLGGLVLSVPGMVLPGVLIPPLLLAAVLVRLIRGPQQESRARRRFERPLALAVAAAIAALSGLAVLVVVVTGGGMNDWDLAEASAAPGMLVMASLVILLVLTAVVSGLAAGRRLPRLPSINPTEP
ncbi:hypothetical protein [Brachybacterium muris]|uniref:Uncharacterized protein n=1 Tax=Brachybacterium muris UCD-AY4 TaxID=1249481 RepID=A0A022L1L1_9MICO|nr:hypothetical protein [Brachybacterium muris]EYT51262.1 hypothetical protein D641_0100220 [Brachybacterium muris UCD-AY4]MCT1654458.1 hypothetical protein [Brachybacterium muris]